MTYDLWFPRIVEGFLWRFRRVQRLVLPDGGGHTWTVLGSDHLPVAAAEDYLESLRA